MSLLSSLTSLQFVCLFVIVVAIAMGLGMVSLDLAVGVNTCDICHGRGCCSCSLLLWGPKDEVKLQRQVNNTHFQRDQAQEDEDLLDECFGGEESVVFLCKLL